MMSSVAPVSVLWALQPAGGAGGALASCMGPCGNGCPREWARGDPSFSSRAGCAWSQEGPEFFLSSSLSPLWLFAEALTPARLEFQINNE